MKNAREIIEIAERNAYLNESARICLKDAFTCLKHDYIKQYAAERALQSLKHSVGVFHPEYKLAKSMM